MAKGLVNKLTKGKKVSLTLEHAKVLKKPEVRVRSHKAQQLRDATAKVKRTKRAVSKHVKKNAGTYKKGLGVTAIAGIGTAGAVATKKRYDKPENKVRRKLGMKTRWN